MNGFVDFTAHDRSRVSGIDDGDHFEFGDVGAKGGEGRPGHLAVLPRGGAVGFLSPFERGAHKAVDGASSLSLTRAGVPRDALGDRGRLMTDLSGNALGREYCDFASQCCITGIGTSALCVMLQGAVTSSPFLLRRPTLGTPVEVCRDASSTPGPSAPQCR